MKTIFIPLLFTVFCHGLIAQHKTQPQADLSAKSASGSEYAALGSKNNVAGHAAGVNETEVEVSSDVSIFFTPGTARMNVIYSDKDNTSIALSISNAQGERIYYETTKTSEGVYETIVDLSARPPGAYVAELVAGDRIYREILKLE